MEVFKKRFPVFLLCSTAAVFVFWLVAAPYHLSFLENLQLFLFGKGYLLERLSLPGGIAAYIAEFLTQFFLYPIAGAAIIAVVFLLTALASYRIIPTPAAIIPAAAITAMQCDISVLPSYSISFLLIVWAIAFWKNRTKGNFTTALLFVAALYWICGPMHILFALWVAGEMLCKRKSGASAVLVAVAAAVPFIASFGLQYSPLRLYQGVFYYRYPSTLPALLFVVPIASMASLALMSFIQKKFAPLVALFAIGVSATFYYLSFDFKAEEAYCYDYLAHNGKWNEIIKKAERSNPDTPLGVSCLNLALGMNGELGERMFDFYQNGGKGLLPDWSSNYISSISSIEIYLRLGLINTAQRCAFEAMETLPDGAKSGRLMKTLAITNLLNGETAVAKKYRAILGKTLFYRQWAKTADISSLEYLRDYRLEQNILTSQSTDKDALCKMLCDHNGKNTLALEYLLGYELLEKDLTKFKEFIPISVLAGETKIRRSWQQALLFDWSANHDKFDELPWPVSRTEVDDMIDFARTYATHKYAKKSLEKRYGHSFWYYYLYR